MADRVYPSAKPNPQPPQAATNGGALPSFPAPKSQAYQRPMYRPTPPSKSKSRGRRCRCSLCCFLLWLVMVVILLAFVCAVAGGVFYLLYRPIRPTFSVSSVHVTGLNLTSSATSAALTSSIDMFVTAKNPNKKIVFIYDDFDVTSSTDDAGVSLGDGSLPGFTAGAGNTTVTKVTVSADAESVDPTSAPSELKKTSFTVAVDLNTKAGVQIGSLTTKKIGIQVHCDGVKVSPPPAKPKNATLAPSPTAAETGAGGSGSCDVTIRVKIWKWTF